MTKPRRYQREGVKQIERFNGRALLADEMGLGKSAQCLWWAQNFLDTGSIVVVCPASIKWNWQREASKHTNRRAEVLEGRTPPKRYRAVSNQMSIINYDILGEADKKGTWLQFLKSIQPQLVIVDECQYIKSRSAKRTRSVHSLCQDVPHVIMVSGTPLTNRPAELWPALHILCPELFPSYFSYAMRYCDPVHKPWGWEYKGAKNLPELHETLTNSCMIRRRKSDVLKDLPSKTRSVIPMDLADRREYDEAVKDFIKWLRKLSPAKARKAANAERLVKLGYLKRLAGSLKLKQVIQWVQNFLEDTDQKLILFGIHKAVLKEVYKHFKDVAVLVDGEVAKQHRQNAFDYFNHNKQKRLFIGNVQAAGVGWSCHSASTVAFCELAWTPGEHTQAEDRIHGLGRGQEGVAAMIYYLVAKNTIEEDLCSILQEKQEVLSSVLDGQDVGELDIMNQLEQMLLKRI